MTIVPSDLPELDVAAASEPSSLTAGGKGRFRRKHFLQATTGFLFGQGALQILNGLAALFLVRVLSVEHYAQFGLAYGFQMAATLLMDLGFSGTIIPLVGDQISDRARIGKYLRAAKHLRNSTFLVIGPFITVAFLAVMHPRHWSWAVQAGLLFSVLLALYGNGGMSCYAAPLLIYGRLRQYYLPQTLSAFVRLMIYVLLRTMAALNAITAAMLYALNVLVNGLIFRRNSRALVEYPSHNQPEVNREVLRYTLPAIPSFIFFAFQSQIALSLISIFGRTVNLAEVAALARLSQLFVIFLSFNLVVIEPRIARLKAQRLLEMYVKLFLVAVALCTAIAAFAFIFPTPFLWLLGRKYAGLSGLIGWVVFTSCISYVANLLYVMNRARKWLFWRGTILEIVLTLGVDVCYAVFIGVRDTRHAVLFSLAASLCSFATHLYIAIYGFLRGPRNPGGSAVPVLASAEL